MEHKKKMIEVDKKVHEDFISAIKDVVGTDIGDGIQKNTNSLEMIKELKRKGFENNYDDLIKNLDTQKRTDLISTNNGESQSKQDNKAKIDHHELTPGLIDKIAHIIDANWCSFGRYLNLSEFELNRIDVDYSNNLAKSVEVLNYWIKFQETNQYLTWCNLKKELQLFNHHDIVQEMQIEYMQEDEIQSFIDLDLNENLKKELQELDDSYIDHIGLENVIREKMELNLDLLEETLGIGPVKDSSNEPVKEPVAQFELKEFLKLVGFSVMGAESFEKFINPIIQHFSLQNWLDLYLDQIFLCKELIACLGFPFEGPENIQFVINLPSQSSLNSQREIAGWNLSSSLSKIEISNKISEIAAALSLGNETWYHGTSGKFAEGILKNGIDLQKGNPKKDFSNGNSFYLQQKFDKAEEWGRSRRTEIYAVLIYNIPENDLHNFYGLPQLDRENIDNWNEVVNFFRSGRNTSKPGCFPEDEYDIDFIRGLISKRIQNTYTQNKEGEIQLCFKSPKTRSFVNGCLIGAVFFQNFQNSFNRNKKL